MSHILCIQTVPWAGSRGLEIAVVITLVIMSLLIVFVIIDKYIHFGRARKIGKKYAQEVAKAIKEGKWDEAYTISESYSKRTHVAVVILIGLTERKDCIDNPSKEFVAKHMNQAMEREILRVQHKHRGGLGIVDAIGNTAPFIGALGGSAFTFAYGIVLAIPTIWFATYLRNKTLLLEGDMKHVASELTSYVEQ